MCYIVGKTFFFRLTLIIIFQLYQLFSEHFKPFLIATLGFKCLRFLATAVVCARDARRNQIYHTDICSIMGDDEELQNKE